MEFEWTFEAHTLGLSYISLSKKRVSFNEGAMWWVPCFHYDAPTQYIYIGFPVWWKYSVSIFKHKSTQGWKWYDSSQCLDECDQTVTGRSGHTEVTKRSQACDRTVTGTPPYDHAKPTEPPASEGVTALERNLKTVKDTKERKKKTSTNG